MNHLSGLKTVFLLFIWCGLLSAPTSAMVVDDIEIKDTIPAEGVRPELVLNGASIRKLYVFAKVYIGSLYLEQAESDENAIFEDDGYKRMNFYLLRNVRGRRIATALKDAMQVNLSTQEIQGFENEFATLISLLGRKIKKGEEGILEYIPGKGTKVTTANKVQGIIPGKAFYNALLTAWIGEQPVNSVMKAELLGKKHVKKLTASQLRRLN